MTPITTVNFTELTGDAETQFVDVGGVDLAYREVGSGDPVILFTRLRGTLDTWDPAFVDALADGYRVIMVDYPGVGYSEGELAPRHGRCR